MLGNLPGFGASVYPFRILASFFRGSSQANWKKLSESKVWHAHNMFLILKASYMDSCANCGSPSVPYILRYGDAGGDYTSDKLACNAYLEGQGDLVSRFIMGISRVTIWVLGVFNPLTKSP